MIFSKLFIFLYDNNYPVTQSIFSSNHNNEPKRLIRQTDISYSIFQSTHNLSILVVCNSRELRTELWLAFKKRSLTQRQICHSPFTWRCELLSNCDLTIFDTAPKYLCPPELLLWIAFKLWFNDLWHSTKSYRHCNEYISNRFQLL